MAVFEQDLLDGSCKLKFNKFKYDLDVAPWYGKVKLLPPDQKNYDIPCQISISQVIYSQKSNETVNCKVKLVNTDYNYKDGISIIGKVELTTKKTYIHIDDPDDPNNNNPVKPDPDDPNNSHISQKYWDTCTISGYVSLPQRYLQNEVYMAFTIPTKIKEDIDGKTNLLAEKLSNPYDGISGHVFIKYDTIGKNIDSSITIKKQNSSTDIDGKVTFEKQPIISDPLDVNVTLMNYYHSVDLNCVFKVPSFRGFFTIPMELTVVPHMCYEIPSKIRVVNQGYRNIDCKVRLLKNDYTSDSSIDGHVSTKPCSFKFLNGRVNLFKVITRRDMTGSLNLIGRRINDINSSITVSPPVQQPVSYNKDINCIVQYGYNDKNELPGFITVNPQISFEQDLLNLSITLREKARIGILVDPRWHYDVFTFKSSLLTLFDKYFQKLDLDIVYGGDPRSDWDIEHLGYVYKYHLEKVPVINNLWKPKESKDSIYHYMIHLFANPVNKVFLFMDKPTMIRGTYLSILADFCYRHDIPMTIITSGGEWFQFSENIKHDYDYQEIDNINHTNMIHVQHHEHQWNKPNDGNFKNPPPRIVY